MLTKREQSVLTYITQHIKQRGEGPLLTEIASGIGIRSKGVTHRYVQSLLKQGVIQVDQGRHRGISLPSDLSSNQRQKYSLPLLGNIAAGKPIEAIEGQDHINMMDFFVGADRFVLRVTGESMIGAGIMDGDMVVVKQCNTARDKDIVVALINQHEATLKYFKNNRDGSITLRPANSTMQSMTYPADQVTIQGVVVAQMRSYV